MALKQRIVLCILFTGGAGYVLCTILLVILLKCSSACIAGIARISFLHTLRNLDVTCKPASTLHAVYLVITQLALTSNSSERSVSQP
jgi:hypothetical protein